MNACSIQQLAGRRREARSGSYRAPRRPHCAFAPRISLAGKIRTASLFRSPPHRRCRLRQMGCRSEPENTLSASTAIGVHARSPLVMIIKLDTIDGERNYVSTVRATDILITLSASETDSPHRSARRKRRAVASARNKTATHLHCKCEIRFSAKKRKKNETKTRVRLRCVTLQATCNLLQRAFWSDGDVYE